MKPHTDELPDIPFDPTSISDGQLMELYSTYTSWQNYLSSRLVEVEHQLNVQLVILSEEKAKAWTQLTGTATDKRVTIDGAKMVADQEHRVAGVKKHVELVKAELGVADRNANLMSRELSRRIGRKDQRWNA